jgi:hypothetical protein
MCVRQTLHTLERFADDLHVKFTAKLTVFANYDSLYKVDEPHKWKSECRDLANLALQMTDWLVAVLMQHL